MTDTNPHHQPEVLEAYWDRDQIAALFADLKHGAVVKRVQVRTIANDTGPEDSVVTLEHARKLLVAGRTTAIQIQYEYDGETWCDTLVVLPDTVRIVRTRAVL